MSKYTTELRYLITGEFSTRLDEVMKNFTYPNDDENFTQRNRLVENIKGYYYFREIGFETPEQFIFRYNNYFQILWGGKYSNIIAEELEALDISLSNLTYENKHITINKLMNNSGSNTSNNMLTKNDKNIYNENPEKNFDIDSSFDIQQYATTANLNKVIEGNDLTGSFTGTQNEADSHNITTNARINFDKLKYLRDIEKSIQNTELDLIMDLEPLFMKIF